MSAVRHEVAALDPDQPVISVKPMNQLVAESLARPRFNMALFALFGGLAVILAAIGIYGVISYSVSRRTNEIGIRMALGASRSDVLKLIMRQGIVLALSGVGIGSVIALLLTRIMSSLLYGVTATDPFVFLAVAGLVIVTSLLACYVPARRAMRIDSTEALRYE
jgi:putative ABC transport system permease protein